VGDGSTWWAPRRVGWWIAALFAIGASCFMVGALPGFVELVGSRVDGLVFFVGSIFFTTAAALQCREAFVAEDSLPQRRRRLDRWSAVVQLAGTIFFNVDTFRALQTGFSSPTYNRLVWTPDAFGSACFLASGYLAYLAVCGRLACVRPREREWQIAAVNLLGCVAFGVAAVASFVVPSTGSVVDLAAANSWTAFGGLCFLVGALLLLPQPLTASSPGPGDGLPAAAP
jgi:hypothetical protein